MDERQEGIIKYWNDEKGYGFIEVGDFPNVQDFFVHIYSCSYYKPEIGDCVTFVKAFDIKKGNTIASKVSPTGESVSAEYFNKEKRKKIKEDLAYEQETKWRERVENSQEFKTNFIYERKEGYICKSCHSEMDYKTMSCRYCKSSDDYY